MKAYYVILCLAMAAICVSCERDLDFSGPSEEVENNLVINSVAVADTSLTIYITDAYPIGKAPTILYYDYDHAVFGKDETSTDYVIDDYFKKTAVRDAEVTVQVNGQETYDAVFNEINLSYECAYVPKSQDRIRVTARHLEQVAYAETTVPQKPKIEVLGHEVIPENPYRETEELFNRVDTIMRLSFRIDDAGGEQYYRLRVRGERTAHYDVGIYATPIVYYYMQDIYFSDDELFNDERLNTNFGGWPANFSNVFDNSLMRGRSYTFTVYSPKAGNTSGYMRILLDDWKSEGPEIPTRVMVELQAISPELYRYLKSAQHYRVTANDANAEPVQIYSNIEGGWGIFGSLSYDRHFVEYRD